MAVKWNRTRGPIYWANILPTSYTITIDHTLIDADLTNYPVLVKLEDAGFVFTEDPELYYFVDDDDITDLKFDRAYLKASEQRSEYYVKIPLISSTVDTVFYLKTNGTVDKEDESGAWANGYFFVSHMNNDFTTADPTGNGYIPTNVGTTDGGGLNGNARVFDGSADYAYCPDSDYGTDDEAYTIKAIIKTSDSGEQGVMSRDDSASPNNRFYRIHTNPTGVCTFIRFDASNNVLSNMSSTATVNDGEYHILSAVFDDAVGSKLYVDGNQENSDAVTTTNHTGTGEPFLIGARRVASLTDYFDGDIDEIRFESAARSAAWEKAEYHNLIQLDLITITSI